MHFYDPDRDPALDIVVYHGIHAGWRFANLGGTSNLRAIAEAANLGPGVRVLEACCGLGDTCYYLASEYGCRVTGLDIDPVHVEAGRQRTLRVEERIAKLIDYVAGDVMTWRAEEPYDVIILLDSLMVIRDPAAAVQNLARSLRPGGRLSITEIMAGPSFDRELAWWLRERDGVASMLAPQAYARALELAGLVLDPEADLDARARSCLDLMSQVVEHREDELRRRAGELELELWRELSAVYRRAFFEARLVYRRMTGLKPSSR